MTYDSESSTLTVDKYAVDASMEGTYEIEIIIFDPVTGLKSKYLLPLKILSEIAMSENFAELLANLTSNFTGINANSSAPANLTNNQLLLEKNKSLLSDSGSEYLALLLKLLE